jgi:hypothetical protein
MAQTVASKVVIDQVFWNPCFGIMFFTYLGFAEGKSVAQIVDKIKADLKTAVMGRCVGGWVGGCIGVRVCVHRERESSLCTISALSLPSSLARSSWSLPNSCIDHYFLPSFLPSMVACVW